MGKAILVLILGSGIVLTKQLYSTQQAEAKTSSDQRAYQEEVIAREIAASAFNVGMGEIRKHGEDLQVAVRAFNGAENEGRRGTHSDGRFAGGRYSVKAVLTSGHSVRVVATGTFGGASYTMHDEYRVFVLTAREGGIVDVSFLESMAGYCSAVYYQAFTMEMEEGEVPEPILLFAPDNRDRSTARPARMIWVDPGTQLNFFIGVDQNCSLRPSQNMGTCQARAYARQNSIDLDDYDYVHHALVVESGNLDQAQEDIWGLVEQRPGKRNVWRISWEDIHNTSWDRPNSENPHASLQALKTHGYDGHGWPTADPLGYRELRDYGDRPDFSDQVIEVGVISPGDPSYNGKVNSYRAQQDQCGEEIDDIPDEGETEETQPTEPEEQPDPTEPPPTEPEPEPEPEPEGDDEYNEFACGCTRNNTKNNKNPVIHRPPGNESNEQLLCLPDPATRTHLRRHNDVQLNCRLDNRWNGNGRNR